MAAERGASENTCQAYERDIADFTEWLSQRGRGVEAATSDDIREFLSALANHGLAASSSARKLSTLRQFFKFLHGDGYRSDDPTTVVDSPRQGRSLPKVLSETDVDRLLAAAHAIEGPAGVRLTAMMELLYATGLRVSELVGLPLNAVTGVRQILLVTGKGNKERLVPITGEARAAVDAYLNVRFRYMPEARGIAVPFPVPWQGRTRHTTALCPDAGRLGPSGGARSPKRQPTHLTPRLRKSLARQWRGPAAGPANARARGYLDDTDLYAFVGRAAQEPRGRHAPAFQKEDLKWCVRKPRSPIRFAYANSDYS